MHYVDAGEVIHEFGGEMQCTADAARSVIHAGLTGARQVLRRTENARQRAGHEVSVYRILPTETIVLRSLEFALV